MIFCSAKQSFLYLPAILFYRGRNRCNRDKHILGGLFYKLCDEILELEWSVALQQLIEIFEDTLKKTKTNR